MWRVGRAKKSSASFCGVVGLSLVTRSNMVCKIASSLIAWPCSRTILRHWFARDDQLEDSGSTELLDALQQQPCVAHVLNCPAVNVRAREPHNHRGHQAHERNLGQERAPEDGQFARPRGNSGGGLGPRCSGAIRRQSTLPTERCAQAVTTEVAHGSNRSNCPCR